MADEHGPSAGQDQQDGVLCAGLAEFARQWTSAVIPTSNIPMSRTEVQAILAGFAELLADSLRQNEFATVPAFEVGKSLVSMQLVGRHALEATVKVLGKALLPALGLGGDQEAQDRLVDLIGAVSAGYLDRLREHIFEQQETMQKAVFRARDAAERALRASERRFRTMFSEAVVGIAIGDIQGHIVNSNLALQEILGYSGAELRQRTTYDLMPAGDAEDMARAYRKLISGTYTSLRSEQRMIRGDGDPIWAHISVSLIRDENGLPDYPVVMIEDITDLHLLQERWQHQSLHDPLTGLLNRALFASKVETAVGGLPPGDRVGLVCLGIDGLSVVNGGMADQVGDRVLKVVADRLRTVVDADTGLLARIDGDRFAMLMVRSTPQRMIELTERAMARISEPIQAMGRELTVTASAGIAERRVGVIGSNDLIHDAEMAMRWAKRDGKAQWAPFESDRGEPERQGLVLATELPQALYEGQFSLEYQPVARMTDRALAGVEVQLSWDHPERGVLDSTDFLALAERTGQVVPLTRWVLRQACTQAASWHAEFGDAAPIVSIGLPNRQVRDQDLIALLQSVIEETGAQPCRVQLEIDQSVVRDAAGEPLEVVSVLTDLGFRVVVSGVGSSGQGPLTFTDLGVHGLKLAPAFVATLGDGDKPDLSTERALSTVMSLAKQAELSVHAPGVESDRHAEALRELGVGLGQGGHFGPPSLPFEIDPMIISGTVDPEW
jgi:PAS domain S-box-containing protein/diguanylate cyclase (GGDEF)-like protein